MSGIFFDKESYWEHIKLLVSALKRGSNGFACDSFVLLTNDKTSDVAYHKALAVQQWLFGYELTGMVLAVVKNTVHVIVSQKKSMDVKRTCR